ncbi:response regulator transcription factor [Sphingobacterium suaedae]|uniref:Response regulator n=1 Tax=Sphingobacterium suaedae TaxID=1686402 RepID=A0ABW5KG12_9SPHI
MRTIITKTAYLTGEPQRMPDKTDNGLRKRMNEIEKPVILLVEEDKQALAYLNKELKSQYTVLRANNGREALDMLEQHDVHLVLTEISLPIMDGIALCRRMKTDVLYSHIPVIFLTAQQTLERKIQGLNSGADAYIEKPFSFEFLMAQLRSVLHNRQMVKDHVAHAYPAGTKQEIESTRRADFIAKLHALIHERISDTDLSVNELAKLMHMSRPTLYRKVKLYSELTPNEIIHVSKLKKAAELLTLQQYSITQIATMVGYSVQSNFSRDFHKHFGIPPSMYLLGTTKQPQVVS